MSTVRCKRKGDNSISAIFCAYHELLLFADSSVQPRALICVIVEKVPVLIYNSVYL